MNNISLDAPKPGVIKATWTPVDLAQALMQTHPEWVGQRLDARLLGQALREAFGMLREQVDGVDVGTVAVPSLGRFQARRAPNKPDQRRVLFMSPKGNEPAAPSAPVAARVEVPLAVLAAVPVVEPEVAPAAEPVVEVPAEAAPDAIAVEPEVVAPAPAEELPVKTAAKSSSKARSKSSSKSTKSKQ